MMWSARTIGIGLVGGMALGVAYFVGLWLTARATPNAQRPGLLLFLSFVGRAALLLGGFYLLTPRDPFGLLAALIGFYFGRYVTTRFITGKGERHANS